MKIIALLILVTGLVQSVHGQAISDEGLILQKCFAVADLQDLYSRQSDGALAPLRVLQHGVSFSDTRMSYQGTPVQFVGKPQIADKSSSGYFLFQEMDVDQDVARASFAYHYSTSGVVVVELLFEKQYAEWNIVKSKIEKR